MGGGIYLTINNKFIFILCFQNYDKQIKEKIFIIIPVGTYMDKWREVSVLKNTS